MGQRRAASIVRRHLITKPDGRDRCRSRSSGPVTTPPRCAVSMPSCSLLTMVTRSATFQRRGSKKRAASGQCLLVPVVKGEASKLDNASSSLDSTIDCPESQTNDISEGKLGASRQGWHWEDPAQGRGSKVTCSCAECFLEDLAVLGGSN